MESVSRVSSDTWRTATWSVPLVFQLVITLFLSTTWAAGKWVFVGDTHRTMMSLSAGAVTSTVVALAISIVLFKSRSSRLRGVGLALAGSSAAVLIGWLVAAFWIYE